MYPRHPSSQPVTYTQPGFTRDIFVLKSRIPVLRIRSRPIAAWFVVFFVVPSGLLVPVRRLMYL